MSKSKQAHRVTVKVNEKTLERFLDAFNRTYVHDVTGTHFFDSESVNNSVTWQLEQAAEMMRNYGFKKTLLMEARDRKAL